MIVQFVDCHGNVAGNFAGVADYLRHTIPPGHGHFAVMILWWEI